MAQKKKGLIEPTVGERPEFIDDVGLSGWLDDMDDASGSAFRNPEKIIPWLRQFFTENFGQNLLTQQERCRREYESDELKRKQKVTA